LISQSRGLGDVYKRQLVQFYCLVLQPLNWYLEVW
jgi:hypothetical protein